MNRHTRSSATTGRAFTSGASNQRLSGAGHPWRRWPAPAAGDAPRLPGAPDASAGAAPGVALAAACGAVPLSNSTFMNGATSPSDNALAAA